MRDRPVPNGFRVLVLGLALYTYVVGYLGAYMRLRGDELACQGWPLCNGQVFPGFIGGVAIAFTHRVAAFVLLVGTARRFSTGRATCAEPGPISIVAAFGHRDCHRAGVSRRHRGADQSRRTQPISPRGLVALLFGALAYVSLHTLPRPADVRKQRRTKPTEQSASRTPASVQRG